MNCFSKCYDVLREYDDNMKEEIQKLKTSIVHARF